jgi:hypothetical protein
MLSTARIICLILIAYLTVKALFFDKPRRKAAWVPLAAFIVILLGDAWDMFHYNLHKHAPPPPPATPEGEKKN